MTVICVGGPYDGHVVDTEFPASSIRFGAFPLDDEQPYYMGTSEIDRHGRRVYRYVA